MERHPARAVVRDRVHFLIRKKHLIWIPFDNPKERAMRKWYAILLLVALTVPAAPAGQAAEMDRTVLPVQEPKRPF